jgi:hypothetical protein
MRHPIVTAIAAAFATLAATAPAHAAPGAGVALEPSRIEATVTRGGDTPPITITNRTREAIAVVAHPYKATQALSGLPEYETSAAARDAGRRLLELDRDRFVLQPGASRQVSARVLACPQSGLGTYAVIEFGVTHVAQAGEANQVTSALRLVAPLLLRYPSRPCLDGGVAGLRAEQAGKARLEFFAEVRNSGNLHARADTTLRLLHRGRTVFTGRFPSENVIPQARREFALPLTARLPAGTYRAVARSTIGGHASTLRRTIRLTGVNTLPTPKLELDGLRVSDARPGASPVVAGTVRSHGTATASGTVKIALHRGGSGSPRDTRTVDVTKLAPGKAHTLAVHLPPLAAGSWTVTAVVTTGGRETDRTDAGFTVTASTADATARWRDWAATHIDVLLGAMAGALALTALLAGALGRRRRSRRRVRPAAAPPDAVAVAELAEIRAALARMEAEVAARPPAGPFAREAHPQAPPPFIAGADPAQPPPPPPAVRRPTAES